MRRSVTESVALDFARSQVEWFRANKIELLGVPVGMMDPRDAERFAARAVAVCLIQGAADPAQVLEAAKDGDALYIDALHLLAREQIEGRLHLSGGLYAAVTEALATSMRPKKVRRKETNYFRDICINILVEKVRDGFDLKETGRSPRHLSACAVVGKAMGLEYDTVHKAYYKFAHKI